MRAALDQGQALVPAMGVMPVSQWLPGNAPYFLISTTGGTPMPRAATSSKNL